MIIVRSIIGPGTRRNAVTALGFVLFAASLAGCGGDKETDSAKQAAGANFPPPTVIVAKAVQQTVSIYSEYVAQT
jgi:hypothetical protein